MKILACLVSAIALFVLCNGAVMGADVKPKAKDQKVQKPVAAKQQKDGVAEKDGAAEFAKQLEALVRAGKMSKAAAAAKLAGMKNSLAEKKDGVPSEKDKVPAKKANAASKSSDGAQSVAEHLQALVAAGKLTKEKAVAKLAAMKKAEEAKKGGVKIHEQDAAKTKKGESKSKSADGPLSVADQLLALVKAGKLTKEQAAAKWAAMKKGEEVKTGAAKINKDDAKLQKVDSKSKSADGSRSVADQLLALVKAGKLTKEQAAAKLAAMKKMAETKKGEPKPKKDGDSPETKKDATKGDKNAAKNGK